MLQSVSSSQHCLLAASVFVVGGSLIFCMFQLFESVSLERMKVFYMCMRGNHEKCPLVQKVKYYINSTIML